MLNQQTEVIEGISVPKEFVDTLKCSIEDIWSDDDEFFDKKDTLRVDTLRKYFKWYKVLPKRCVTYLLRDKEKVEQTRKTIVDYWERTTNNKHKTSHKHTKKSYRRETFTLNDTEAQCFSVSTLSRTEELSETELVGCCSDTSICQEIKSVLKKAIIKPETLKCNKIFHPQDSNSKLITFLNDETGGLINKEYAGVLLSEDCNKRIMSVTSDDVRKLKKRKHEISGSDISVLLKQHCNRDRPKVENIIDNIGSDNSSEKLNSGSEKIYSKNNVHMSAGISKISRSLEDNLSSNNSKSKSLSGDNSEESHSFSKYSFTSKQNSVSTQKQDTVKCIVVSDSSDENRSCVVNSGSRKKKISHFVSKKLHEEDCMIFSEDVTSDDEAWVMQAPTSMNIDSLFGQSIKLNDNFLLKDNDGKIYEGFVSPVGNTRNANLIIPSVKTKSLQLRSLPVAGGIIIEEKVHIPHATTLMLHKKKKTPLPQSLRQRHPLLGIAFEELSKPTVFSHSNLHKKEKKKRSKKISLEATTDKINQSIYDEADIYRCVEKKKKKRRKHEVSVASGSDDMDNVNINVSEMDYALKQKKMKHNITNVTAGNVMIELESDSVQKQKEKVGETNELGTEMLGTVTTELDSKSSTKKKKKKKYSDINEVSTTDLNSDSFAKKEKKKHIDINNIGTTEVVDSFTTERGGR